MANTLITPVALTREALRVLHQKSNFIGTINRSYDDSFAKTGAKIGDTLRIRNPNEFTIRTGATRSNQDVSETYQTLQVATQKGVDFSFSSVEWTLSLDEFSKRYIVPAMTRLAAEIEADALSMYKDVYNIVDGDAAAKHPGSPRMTQHVGMDALFEPCVFGASTQSAIVAVGMHGGSLAGAEPARPVLEGADHQGYCAGRRGDAGSQGRRAVGHPGVQEARVPDGRRRDHRSWDQGTGGLRR